jgi:hypothetical protein
MAPAAHVRGGAQVDGNARQPPLWV